jgi:peptide/nickel transport system ATP-binding protein
MALLEVDDLKIQARKDDGTPIPIVKGVSFEVKQGEVVALIGESGSGKTTISLAALAYCKPGLEFSGGEVRLHGKDLLTMAPIEQRDMRGQNVAYLAQSAAATFNPAITIGEQVTESAVLHGILSQKEADERALALYDALELPDPDRLGRRYPHQVSGGQLQRLMAAMALCGKPDLLVLDEPTTALDVTTQIEVLKAFKKVIREQGSAAIYVTHDLSVVAQIADHIVVLYAGEVQEMGTADQIINHATHDYTRRLMAAVRPSPVAGMGEEDTGDHAREEAALAARNIIAGYGGVTDGIPAVTILRDVNVDVQRGEVIGVIGESGCGKSTLARVMAGLLPTAQGEIVLDGKTLEPALEKRDRDELRKVQFVFQMADTALNPRQRISDILGRPIQFYLGLSGKEKRKKVAELLDMVELPVAFADRYPMELSGGQKQRINLARALAGNPEVLLCDEVTSALDSIVGANVIELLKGLRKDTGVSFVFISHDLSTVASFADKIVVLYAGRVVEQGPTDQVLSPPFHPYTRLLITSVPEMRIGWLEDTMQTREAAAGIARGVEITATGCPFFNRCPIAIEGTCDKEVPPIRMHGSDHQIACHRTLDEMEESESAPQKILHGFERSIDEEDKARKHRH